MSNPYGLMMAVFSEKYKKEGEMREEKREENTRSLSCYITE